MVLGSIGRSQSLVDEIGHIAGSGKVREDKALRSQLVARVWRAQVHGVD